MRGEESAAHPLAGGVADLDGELLVAQQHRERLAERREVGRVDEQAALPVLDLFGDAAEA